jgi:Zn-dependent protease with chaperone function
MFAAFPVVGLVGFVLLWRLHPLGPFGSAAVLGAMWAVFQRQYDSPVALEDPPLDVERLCRQLAAAAGVAFDQVRVSAPHALLPTSVTAEVRRVGRASVLVVGAPLAAMAADESRRDEAAAVIAHECIHVARRDDRALTALASSKLPVLALAATGAAAAMGGLSLASLLAAASSATVAGLLHDLATRAVMRAAELRADRLGLAVSGDAHAAADAIASCAHDGLAIIDAPRLVAMWMTHPPLATRLRFIGSLTPTTDADS